MGVVGLSFVLLIAGLLVGGLVLVCVSVWHLQLLLVGCGRLSGGWCGFHIACCWIYGCCVC